MKVKNHNDGDKKQLKPAHTSHFILRPFKAEIIAYRSVYLQIKFVGVRGTSFRGDAAIDDIFFTDGNCSQKPYTAKK